MRPIRFLAILAAAAFSVAAFAVPGVLIIQENAPNNSFGDPNVAVGNVLAAELEKEGVFAPVVWSLTDPIFRSAVNEGIVKDSKDTPDLAKAQAVANKLKLEYIIFVRLYQHETDLLGRIRLFKRGKQIWKDPDASREKIAGGSGFKEVTKKDKDGAERKDYKPTPQEFENRPMSIMGPRGLLVEDTAISLVRTWVAFIKADPFKGQAFSPKIPLSDADQGQVPTVPHEALTTTPVKVDNKQLFADLDGLIKSGQAAQAILILRDAVDVAPQDIQRRLALVQTLLLVEQPELAAKEARRAAELLPDKIELRAMAARAWMRAGREDEAMADLNEAVARDPNSVETRTLLAEVNLVKGRPQQAIEHVDAVLKEKPTAEQWFRRALCNALLGKPAEVTSDLAKAKELGLSESTQDVASRYVTLISIMDRGLTQLGNDLRSLMQRSQVRRTDPEVKEIAEAIKNQVAGWTAFLAATQPPKIHRSSQDRRVLAFTLLSQCLTDLSTFIVTNDGDALAEARINLGEALKHYATAQTSYRAEIGGTAKLVGS